MIRIVLLLTTVLLIQPSFPHSRAIPPSKGSTVPGQFLRRVEENCKCAFADDPFVNRIWQAWDKVRKGGQPQTSIDLIDLQGFLNRVVDDYNAGLKDAYKDLENAWKYYMVMFGKRYSPSEAAKRKEIFRKNKERLEKHNELFQKGKVSYSLKINHLSDQSPEDLKKAKHLPPRIRPAVVKMEGIMVEVNESAHLLHTKGPETFDSIDWRSKGRVTPVSFQGDCAGGCYAFTGIGALEAYYKKRTGNLFGLSVQNILDCTEHLGNNGCQGGYTDLVFQYAQTNGVMGDAQYPYTMNGSRICKWKKEDVVATVGGYFAVKGNERALKHAVSKEGPVAAVIFTPDVFYSYGQGVFHPENCAGPDIAFQSVLIVGYGSDPKHGDYWIIKNSFGKWWGEDGFIRMARNKNNLCGVASQAFYVV